MHEVALQTHLQTAEVGMAEYNEKMECIDQLIHFWEGHKKVTLVETIKEGDPHATTETAILADTAEETEETPEVQHIAEETRQDPEDPHSEESSIH